MGAAPEIRKPFIDELERTKPKIIYFQKNFSILGRSPEMYGQFFLDYLDQQYVLLKEYDQNGIQYVSTVPVTEKVDLEGRLYIRKENAPEVIRKMLGEGLIKEK
jgi:hypothetical protein